MSKHVHKELIGMLLDQTEPSPEAKRWLATSEGKRESRAYRAALDAFDRLYGEAATYGTPVYYSAMSAPVGKVWVAATEKGLVRVSFRQSEDEFARELHGRLNRKTERSAERTAAIVRQLAEYFAGRRSRFEIPVDLATATPFQRRVLEAACSIPPGQVISYGALARRIGQPQASRAVGGALGRNPVPIVIPCHRIIREGGELGGYTGGLDIKKKLLLLEGAL